MQWRYAKEIVRRKVALRDLTDSLVEMVLSSPDSVVDGKKGRLVAQKERVKQGFGTLLIRVVYEQLNEEKVVVSAYWARPERYQRGLEQ